jgi:hypothetical protein
MGKIVIPASRLAQLHSFGKRGEIEEAVLSAMIDNIKVAELTAAAEAGDAIVVTVQLSELDGTALGIVPVYLKSTPVTGGKGLATVGSAGALTGGTQTFNFNETSGETLIVNGTDDGGATWTAFQRTFTFSTTGSNFANIAALLGDLNTAAKWNGSSLPATDGQFVITNTGDALVLTALGDWFGGLRGIQIDATSTAIGATTDTDLLFTGDVYALGAGGTPIAGQGTADLYLMSESDGSFVVSVANDQAEKNLVQVWIDDGLTELLELTFA